MDYKIVFGSPEGKRVLWDLMKKSGFLDKSYVANDPHATSFNEGARNLVLHIVHRLRINIKKLEEQITKEDENG